jgi:two-component system sensor histidine kinase EvgS
MKSLNRYVYRLALLAGLSFPALCSGNVLTQEHPQDKEWHLYGEANTYYLPTPKAGYVGYCIIEKPPQMTPLSSQGGNRSIEGVYGPYGRIRYIHRSKVPWGYVKELALRGSLIASASFAIFLIWFHFFFRQVKARERAEQALREQLNFQKVMMDVIPHPIYVRDSDLRLLSCNTAYESALGVQRQEILGKKVDEMGAFISVLDNAEPIGSYYKQLLQFGTPYNHDKSIYLRGKLTHIYNWAVRLDSTNTATARIVGGWMNIGERREMLCELAAAREKAEQASEAKSSFLATMSHEIRTPMNALIGVLELLQISDCPPKNQSSIDTALGSAQSLLALIDDILDLSKMEAGKLQFNCQPIDIRRAIDEVIKIFTPVAQQKSLILSASVSPAVNSDYLLDPLRFKQLLTNLVGNALKFTHTGSVQIRLQRYETRGDSDRLLLCVEDSGVGIDAADIPGLFIPFSQAQSTLKRVSGGTGLGLSICKQLAEQMHGGINLISEPNKGTRVEVTVMLRKAIVPPLTAPHQPTTGPLAPLPPCTVAIIDDHPANRMVMHEQLLRLGCSVMESEGGHQALLQAARHRFDVIFCDCNMPDIDGYEFVRRLRNRPEYALNQATPVIGFTASNHPEVLQYAQQAGMNACLIKPVSLQKINAILHNLLTDGEPVPFDSEPERPIFDERKLNQIAFNHPQIIKRLSDTLISTNNATLPLLKLAICEGRKDDVSRLAHKILGGAQLIGAVDVIELSEALEGQESDVKTQRFLAERLQQAIRVLHKKLESL